MRTLNIIIAAAALALAVAGEVRAQTPDPGRGERLYGTACVHCHGQSVHDRKQRAASNFDEIRGYVERWSRFQSMPWTPDDINDVAIFLNERYYRYRCNLPGCKRDAATLQR